MRFSVWFTLSVWCCAVFCVSANGSVVWQDSTDKDQDANPPAQPQNPSADALTPPPAIKQPAPEQDSVPVIPDLSSDKNPADTIDTNQDSIPIVVQPQAATDGSELPPININDLRNKAENSPPDESISSDKPPETHTRWEPPQQPGVLQAAQPPAGQGNRSVVVGGQDPLQQLSPSQLQPSQLQPNRGFQINPATSQPTGQPAPPPAYNSSIPMQPATSNLRSGMPIQNPAVNNSPQRQSVLEQTPSDTNQNVVPATFNQELPNRSQPTRSSVINNTVNNNTVNSNDLSVTVQQMGRFDVSTANGPLPGQPTTLLELLQKSSPLNHKALIQQYWDTYFEWANLKVAREYQRWLAQVPTPNDQSARLLLQAARLTAQDQALSAEIQLGKAQSRLQEFVATSDAPPPLPSDPPLIKPYQMHYEWYASRGLLPRRFRGIDTALPRTLQLISQRGKTTRAARSAMDQTKNSMSGGQVPLGTVLESGRLWIDASKRMVGSVTSYNKSIADYALTINRNGKSPEQVVAMLISKPSNGRVASRDAVRNPRTMVPAVGNPPTNRSVNSNGMPRNPSSGAGLRSSGSLSPSLLNSLNQPNRQNNRASGSSLPKQFSNPAGGQPNSAGQNFGSPNSTLPPTSAPPTSGNPNKTGNGFQPVGGSTFQSPGTNGASSTDGNGFPGVAPPPTKSFGGGQFKQ